MAVIWETKNVIEEPEASISAGAIGLNNAAAELLGKTPSVVVGYDDEKRTIIIAPNSAVKAKEAVKRDVRANKRGLSISCRTYMPVILAAMEITLDNRKRLKCEVEAGKDGMLTIKLP